MSYRLINANTIAESYTEVHDMPCIYADLPRGLDGGHYDMRGMDELQSENAKLREQMERLVTLLRVDCDIDASWDGLRRFWSIELTEGGCLMRDRACKAEADVAKLFALLKHESEQTEKLRELVRDMWEFGFGDNSGANNAWAWHERTDELEGRMRELGVEA